MGQEGGEAIPPARENPREVPIGIEGIRILADVYISSYIFLHFYICLCVFAYFLCVFVYILGFSSYKIDSLISEGRRRRPPTLYPNP